MPDFRTLLAAFAAVLALAGTPAPADAQTSADAASADPSSGDASASSALADGEIRKIDKDAGKITIRHGPLRNLDMPGMTMVFGVKDEAMLDDLAQGEKIRFRAERVDGKIIVTLIEASP